MNLVIVILVLAFSEWLARRALPILDAKWQREHALADRALSLRERKLQLREERVKHPQPIEPMPGDLVAICEAWEDDWAKSDQRRSLEGLYAEYKSWDEVRRHIQPGRGGDA